MNERIKELAKKAGGHPNYRAFRGHFLPPPHDYIHPDTIDLEKFAELIVRECAGVAEVSMPVNSHPDDRLKVKNSVLDHFGVGE